RLHSAGSTLLHLWPTGSSSGWPPSITARYFSSCPSDSTSRWTPCPPGTASGGFRFALICIRLSPSCPFKLLHTFLSPGPRGITPAFGYGAPHPSARGTSTLLNNALLSAHYGPLRLPTGPPRRLCLPVARWSPLLPPCGASQAPRLIFSRALSPTTPEGPTAACACCFAAGFWLHPSRRTGHLRIPIEAESGSLALRLTGSPPESAGP